MVQNNNPNMAKDVQSVIPVRPGYQVKRGPVKSESGLSTKYVARAVFDTAGTDSSGAANTTIATHGLGVYLPAKAIITSAYYQVITGFTSAGGNAGTVALQAEGANDLVTATAVSNAIYGTTGIKACVPVQTAATMVQVSVERELKAVVAGQVMTAGKLMLTVEYVIGD